MSFFNFSGGQIPTRSLKGTTQLYFLDILAYRKNSSDFYNINPEIFIRMLTVHCDQNNSYEITINGFQVRKINELRNVIFGLRYGKPSSALRPKLGCSPS